MSDQWIVDVMEELRRQHDPLRPHDPLDQEVYDRSIYHVPKTLTDVNSQAYKPRLASFGPYHHDCPRLCLMEPHKQRAVIHFLHRIAKASKTPEDVYDAMKNVEPRLLAYYDILHVVHEEQDYLGQSRLRYRDWCQEKDEFLKLMIVDGCFALEVMLAQKRSAAGEQSEYHPKDRYFGEERENSEILNLKRDMLLLENQISFLALTTLAAIDGSGIGDVSTLIKTFYNVSSVSPDYGLTDEGFKGRTEESFHILDSYRKILTREGDYLPSYEKNVKTATKLRNAGVSFRKNKTKSFRDISFNDGVLSLPPLKIDDTTESLLLNLMAFKRLHVTAGNQVTAYAFFMDGLIKTADDVALLRSEEIVMGWLDDRNIANMFNMITKKATLDVFQNHIQIYVNSRLNSYCKQRMRRSMTNFVENISLGLCTRCCSFMKPKHD